MRSNRFMTFRFAPSVLAALKLRCCDIDLSKFFHSVRNERPALLAYSLRGAKEYSMHRNVGVSGLALTTPAPSGAVFWWLRLRRSQLG